MVYSCALLQIGEKGKLMNKNLASKSIEIIKQNQNEYGSYIASPYFSVYNYCWIRDGCFTAYSMDIIGEYGSAAKFFDWSDEVISSKENEIKKIIKMKALGQKLLNSDYLPSRYKLNGEDVNDDWPNFQLDGYGTWLWALCEHIEMSRDMSLIKKYEKSIKLIIDYLENFWDSCCFDCWQENGEDIHTSTLACIYGGLKSISKYMNESAAGNTADKIKEFILKNCTKDGRFKKSINNEIVDTSLLWVAIPFNVLGVNDSLIKNTVLEIEQKLMKYGGLYRYEGDTYYGGGEWIIMSCWLGLYYCRIHKIKEAKKLLNWVETKASENGELPEQVLEHVMDESSRTKWESLWGEVASPVLWSHAMYIILFNKINLLSADNKLSDNLNY